MQYVKKENPEYRFISYVDSQGKENAFWRLKNYWNFEIWNDEWNWINKYYMIINILY